MKRHIFSFIVFFSLVLLSCTNNDIRPGIGFIKARVNGVDVVYNTVPQNLNFDINYIKPGVLNIWFNKDKTSSQYWAITIMHDYAALDVSKLSLPFVIKGPNKDFTSKSPEVSLMIVNPDGGPYGELIAGGSTFDNNLTVVITSVKGDIINGTFSGTGVGKFENG